MITTNIQIRFSDIDMLRHVNNIVLQNYYDLGKCEYFRDIVGLPPVWEEYTFTTASTTTDYIEEVHISDKIAVRTQAVKIGTKSLIFSQEIVDQNSGAVKSRSRSVMVAFDLHSRLSIEIPIEWREKIIAHEENIECK